MKIILALSINIVLLALTFLFLNYASIAIVISVSLLVWFFYYLWKRQNQVMERIVQKISGQQIIMPAEHIVFRAVESSGYSQSSGMGYMALTEKCLYFELILLDLVITVPTPMLKGAEFVKRLKGVSPAKKMLRIMYTNQQGVDDSIAINVKDMARWREVISEVSERNV